MFILKLGLIVAWESDLDYAVIFPSSNDADGLWSDNDGSYSYSYVCEKAVSSSYISTT